MLLKFHWSPAPGQRLGLTLDGYRRDNARAYVNKTSTLYPEGTKQDSSTGATVSASATNWTARRAACSTRWRRRVYHQNAAVEDLTHARYFTGNQPYQREIATGFFNKSNGAQAEASLALSAASCLAYGIAWDRTASSRPWLEKRLVIATGATQLTTKNRMADMDTDKSSAWLRGDIGFTLGGLAATFTPGLRTEHRKLTPTGTAGYLVAVPGAAAEVRTESDAYTVPSLKVSLAVAPDLLLTPAPPAVRACRQLPNAPAATIPSAIPARAMAMRSWAMPASERKPAPPSRRGSRAERSRDWTSARRCFAPTTAISSTTPRSRPIRSIIRPSPSACTGPRTTVARAPGAATCRRAPSSAPGIPRCPA